MTPNTLHTKSSFDYIKTPFRVYETAVYLHVKYFIKTVKTFYFSISSIPIFWGNKPSDS